MNSAEVWREYLFLLGCYGAYTAKFTNHTERQRAAAFVSAGVIVEQITDDKGGFDFNVSPLYENYQVRVAADGFQTVTVGPNVSSIQLALAPQSDTT